MKKCGCCGWCLNVSVGPDCPRCGTQLDENEVDHEEVIVKKLKQNSWVVTEGPGRSWHGKFKAKTPVTVDGVIAWEVQLEAAGPWDELRTNALTDVVVLAYSLRLVDRGPA